MNSKFLRISDPPRFSQKFLQHFMFAFDYRFVVNRTWRVCSICIFNRSNDSFRRVVSLLRRIVSSSAQQQLDPGKLSMHERENSAPHGPQYFAERYSFVSSTAP